MSKATKETLIEAIANAKAIVFRKDGVDYYTSTLNQRTPDHPEQCGSVFSKNFLTRKSDGVVEDLGHRLFEDHLEDWVELDATKVENVIPGCRVFRLKKSGIGQLGIVDLATLGTDDLVTVDDRKGTGFGSVVLPRGMFGRVVDEAYAIVSPETDLEGAVHWTLATVHPGTPAKAQTVSLAELGWKHGDKITVAQARKAGFTTAKVA